jgi:hypothetical protein
MSKWSSHWSLAYSGQLMTLPAIAFEILVILLVSPIFTSKLYNMSKFIFACHDLWFRSDFVKESLQKNNR